MNITIDANVFFQIGNALMGMYIVQKWYIEPVFMQLIKEDEALLKKRQELTLLTEQTEQDLQNFLLHKAIVQEQLRGGLSIEREADSFSVKTFEKESQEHFSVDQSIFDYLVATVLKKVQER